VHGNWDGPIPHVHRWPYDYSKLNKDESDYVIAGQDFVPQHIPLRDNEEEMNH
jgi:cytochrome c oxidase subunit 1